MESKCEHRAYSCIVVLVADVSRSLGNYLGKLGAPECTREHFPGELRLVPPSSYHVVSHLRALSS